MTNLKEKRNELLLINAQVLNNGMYYNMIVCMIVNIFYPTKDEFAKYAKLKRVINKDEDEIRIRGGK